MHHSDKGPNWVLLQWAIIGTAALSSFWGALNPFEGDTANSRMATVYALVHHGTWEIAPSGQINPFESGTIDKVRVEGKLYSSKPPVMPLIMTAQYGLLHYVLGYDLNQPEDRKSILGILTATCISLPFLLSGMAFYRLLGIWGIKPWAKTVVLLSLMWGSEYAGYAATMNNHVPATACLIGAFWGYWALDEKVNVKTSKYCAIIGLLLGLAVVIDLPATIFVLILAIAFVRKFSKNNILWGVIGASIPLLIHAGIMISLSASPLPFQLNHDFYLYEESYWRNPVAIDALNHPWGLYLFNMTFGRVGHFILYPLLFVGVMALFHESRRAESSQRWWSVGGLAALGILIVYYLTSTNNYGGVSYGFRWLIIATPFLLMGLALGLNQIKSRWLIGTVCVLLMIGLFSTYQCRSATWSLHQEWPTKIYGPLY